MISSELRTLFVDSVHTRKNNNGSYTLPLFEQIGIQPGMVGYVDDISLAGQYSAVNLTNNKLYVLEVTPGDARFTENGGAAVLATDWDGKTRFSLSNYTFANRRHFIRRFPLLCEFAENRSEPQWRHAVREKRRCTQSLPLCRRGLPRDDQSVECTKSVTQK